MDLTKPEVGQVRQFTKLGPDDTWQNQKIIISKHHPFPHDWGWYEFFFLTPPPKSKNPLALDGKFIAEHSEVIG